MPAVAKARTLGTQGLLKDLLPVDKWAVAEVLAIEMEDVE
jgi:hypothetical protein